MPLADPRSIIAQAHNDGRAAVGANVSTLHMVRGVLRAAESTARPVLIQFNRSGLELIGGVSAAASIVDSLADDLNAVAALHLDHADTLDELSRAINAGFTSVMIDGSTLPVEQHLHLAREAKALVQWSGLPLEAELGHVAGDEDGVTISDARWTDPDEAARFVRETNVDWLAVAVGNTHGGNTHGGNTHGGNTHGGKTAGGLQIDRLQAIRAAVDVPLVLHGASGLSDDELSAAVALGVAKVNVGTALHQAAADGMAASLNDRPGNLRAALLASERRVDAAARDLLTADWAVGSQPQ